MEWILCDERLPKEGQMVLTTIRGHDVIIVQDEETFEEAIERVWNEVCYVSVGFIGSDGWYGADGYPLIVHPIAWMPLPKPYRKTENSSEKPNNFDKDINVRSKDCETCKHYKLACELFSEICKYEPTTQTETQNSNLTFKKRTMRDCYNCKRYETEGECIECHYEPKDECAKEYEELGLKELKELIEADRKTEPSNSEKPNNSKVSGKPTGSERSE